MAVLAASGAARLKDAEPAPDGFLGADIRGEMCEVPDVGTVLVGGAVATPPASWGLTALLPPRSA
ncbi:MAG TPA: hypothetical protein VGX23_27560 [Actinocrinis sp.]|nr:hypothetical protein [Actinocrinis sp.]